MHSPCATCATFYLPSLLGRRGHPAAVQPDDGRVPRNQLRPRRDGRAQEDRRRRLQGEAPGVRHGGGGLRTLVDREGEAAM